jgi:hypothetical protein
MEIVSLAVAALAFAWLRQPLLLAPVLLFSLSWRWTAPPT